MVQNLKQLDKSAFEGEGKCMVLRHKELEAESGHEAGRKLLAEMYRQVTGQELPPIVKGPHGKPCFPEGDWHFSITHTKRHVFCALSDRPIGIDAEETDRKIHLDLAEKILSPNEKKRYDAAPDKPAALLKLWVLKEAAAKCTGEGIYGYPNKTDFSPDDPRIQIIHGCYLAIVEE